MFKWGELGGWASWNGQSMKMFVSHVNACQRPFGVDKTLSMQVDKMTHFVIVSQVSVSRHPRACSLGCGGRDSGCAQAHPLRLVLFKVDLTTTICTVVQIL